ncbi:MAG: methyltransferase domain-containing protein [Rickettsiales bacterium]|nr:methyltransferase domain-containing protein [Rickettsiales bacterium]
MDTIFDRKLLKQNRARALKNYANHNFLVHEIANRIIDNINHLDLQLVDVLELGAMDGYLSNNIVANNKIIADEDEMHFEENSFDVIVSNLNLHFINDIPAFLMDVKRILKKDGIFIASFFGEENLNELAHVLHLVQNERFGGVSPMMPPTIDVKTAAMLLQKAGFENPISDFDKIEVLYSQISNLFKDIKNMGQGNILQARSKRFFTRGFLQEICKKYFDEYSDSSKKVKATFEVVTIMGKKTK